MGEEHLREGETKEENGSPSRNRPDTERLFRLQDRKARKGLLISGKKSVSSFMILYFQENNIGRPRYAVYASRRLGSAVERNRIKRVFREALYSKKKELKGYDFIVIPKEAAKGIRVREAISHVGEVFLKNGILIG